MAGDNRLREDLTALYEALRSETRERWDRDLPLYELLFDRWERARSLGFGEGASIYHSSYVFGEVHVGENTWIGPHTILDGSGGLRIGANCSISAGVQIYTHDSVAWAVSGGGAPYAHSPVSIGDGCVIGALSFVNRTIPAGSLAVGSPCRVVGHTVVSGDEVRIEYDDA